MVFRCFVLFSVSVYVRLCLNIGVMCAFFPPKILWVYVRGKNAFLGLWCRFFPGGFVNPIKTIYFLFEYVPEKVLTEKEFFSRFKKEQRRDLKQLKLLPHKPERNKKEITGEFPRNSVDGGGG